MKNNIKNRITADHDIKNLQAASLLIESYDLDDDGFSKSHYDYCLRYYAEMFLIIQALHHCTNGEMSAIIGKSSSTWSRIINLAQEPTCKEFFALLEFAKINPQHFFKDYDFPNHNFPKHKDYIEDCCLNLVQIISNSSNIHIEKELGLELIKLLTQII